MIELRTFGDLGPRRSEEGLTETESDRSGHDCETEVEKIGDTCDRTTDEHAGSFDHLHRSILRRSPGDGRDRRARCFRLETSPRPTSAQSPVGNDADMTDMTGIAVDTVEQSTVEHDPAADTGGHDHGEIVRDPDGRAEATFADCQSLRIVVDKRRQSGQFLDATEKREPAPRRNVHRRYGSAAARHRATGTHAAHDRQDLNRRENPGDKIGDHSEQFIARAA